MKFSKLSGVLSTRVGYLGGSTPSPTYASVSAGDGHTEAIRLTIDRTVISYEQILDVFFSEHNPTVRAVRGACVVFGLRNTTHARCHTAQSAV